MAIKSVIQYSEKQKAQLESLGLFSNEEILNHLPFRYYTTVRNDLTKATIGESVSFEGVIIGSISTIKKNKLIISNFKIKVLDEIYQATIFNRPWLNKMINKNVSFFATYQGNKKLLINSYNLVELNKQLGIHPVYHLNKSINNRQFESIIAKTLDHTDFDDLLPQELSEKYGFIDLSLAYRNIHQPANQILLNKSIERIKYQQLFFFNLQMLYHKQVYKCEKKRKIFDRGLIEQYIKSLPFTLNNDQNTAIEEILKDLSDPNTMYRLLLGDVGSGKTIISFIAMYATALSSQQAVLLAPTDLLANQHYQSALKLFKQDDILFLSSNLAKDELTKALALIASGEVKIIIGTHRLFQDDVNYANLGIVIADEQQRFGVKQREALFNKGSNCDILQMSATPIPQTIAQFLYADMDVSYLKETIYQDKKIVTRYLKENSFFRFKNEIEKLLDSGNLCYIVTSAIDSENKSKRNLINLVESLNKHYQGRYKIGYLHSQVDSDDQSEVFNSFINHEIQIMVCTSIIEVGIDVKDANVIIIYDAQQFGLSQLHQLRGRVGRHGKCGYCYFLSSSEDEDVVNRLEFLEKNTNGYDIALYDFNRRGFGDIAGVRQSGKSFLSLINSEKDLEMIKDCFNDAREYIKKLDTIKDKELINLM